MKDRKAITFKNLNKSNVWDIQENDVFRMWTAATKNPDLKEGLRHFTDIIRTAFDVEEVTVDRPEIVKKYNARGFKTSLIPVGESQKKRYAVKKRPIMRITDLTYENIHHISAAKLVEVLSRNFGGGWDSIPQNVQDIILMGFDVSTTTLPADRLHKKGGLYDRKMADGYDVLEIAKGGWTEAIFVKEKEHAAAQASEPQHAFAASDDDSDDMQGTKGDDRGQGDMQSVDDEDDYDEDKLTEESYRTTFETNPDELNIEDAEISDDEQENDF